MPSPKWKLVVETGPINSSNAAKKMAPQLDTRIKDLTTLIQTYMPENKNASLAAYLPGFTSLRLLLLKKAHTVQENKWLHSALESFDRHKVAGLSNSDVAALTARDFMTTTRPTVSLLDHSSTSGFGVSSDSQSNTQLVPGTIRVQQNHDHSNTNTRPSLGIGMAMDSQSSMPTRQVPGTVQVQQSANQDLALASPSLHSLVGGRSDMLPLHLTASQISAMLQHDAMNFNDL
jgi:hypothetical protein